MLINKRGMHIRIPAKLFNKFKSVCALIGSPMTAVVQELIEKFLKTHS